MIVVGLSGGLGNQLFQYAAGRRLAHARQTELVLDLGWYERIPSSNTPREYELERYAIQARATERAEAAWCRLHQGRILRRLSFIPRRWRHYRERRFEFDCRVLDLPDNSYLDGFWQSYKYFEDIAELIRAEIVPAIPMGDADKLTAEEMASSTQAVSLHVRRGDYVTNPTTARAHVLCDLEYYEKAVALVSARLASPHFFVFSDDMAWARANLVLPGAATYVDHNGPAAAFQDLRLMSLCHHHIIANSSFSWWGAWLNARADKIVTAPAAWFPDQRHTRDLTPENWTRL